MVKIEIEAYKRTKQPFFNVEIQQKNINCKDIHEIMTKVDEFLRNNFVLCLKNSTIIDARNVDPNFKFEMTIVDPNQLDLKENTNINKYNTQLIKDATYLSDHNYQKWRKFNPGIGPSLRQLKYARTFFGNYFKIYHNKYGYYYSPYQKIKFVAEMIIKNQNYKPFTRINIKICGDATNLTRSKLKLLNLSFTILNEGKKAKTSKGNYILGVFEIEKENYFQVKQCLSEILAKLKKIKCITIDKNLYRIKFYMNGDMSFLEDVYGLKKANSNHPCVYCKMAKNDFGKLAKDKSFIKCSVKDIKLNARTIEEAKSISASNKSENFGYNYSPIIDFIQFYDCLPDPLHLFIRICEKLTDLFVYDLNQLDGNIRKSIEDKKFLYKFYVFCSNIKIINPFNYNEKNKVYTMRSLDGEEYERLFENFNVCFENNDLFFSEPKVTLETFEKNLNVTKKQEKNLELKFLRINRLWKDFLYIINFIKNCSNFSVIDTVEFQIRLDSWLKLFLKVYFSIHITPYMHILVYHLSEFIKLHKNIDLFTCQGMEKLNDILTISYHRSNNKHFRKKKYLEILIKKRTRLEFSYMDFKYLTKKLNECKESDNNNQNENLNVNDNSLDLNEEIEIDSDNFLIYFYESNIEKLNPTQWLSDSHIDNVLMHFKTKYTNINYLYNFTLRKAMLDYERHQIACEVNFENTDNLIVILNCFNQHWILLTNICNGENSNNVKRIFVYDSLNNSNYLQGLKPLFKIMYPNEKYKYINVVQIKNEFLQKGNNDCGLFALAYAKAISEGLEPSFILFDQDSFRDEYNNFLENKEYNVKINRNYQNSNLNIKNYIINF